MDSSFRTNLTDYSVHVHRIHHNKRSETYNLFATAFFLVFVFNFTRNALWNILVRSRKFFRTFQLNFKSLCTYLKAVHGLYGGLCRCCVVVRYETEALWQVRLFVYEHFGRYHVAEGQEGWSEVRVGELLREMVYEQVATFWPWKNKIPN